jgi:amino acid transporter
MSAFLKSSKELDYRLKNEGKEAEFNRWKSLIFSIAILIGTVIIVIVCFSIIFSPNISADDKSKSWAVITLIVGGYLGYITGKATK